MAKIHLFHRDLRLHDNPALVEAAQGGEVIALYIDDTIGRKAGAAARWYLHHSLQSLNRSLGGKLSVMQGDPSELLPGLCRQYHVDEIHFNGSNDPARRLFERKLQAVLLKDNIKAVKHNGNLLWRFGEIVKADDTPYKVFTAFYRRCLASGVPSRTLPAPKMHVMVIKESLSVDSLGLLPRRDWGDKLAHYHDIGEKAALAKLQKFRKNVGDYVASRDIPARSGTSGLSPHLAFGEVSPRKITAVFEGDKKAEAFIRQIIWREFCSNLLFHFPEMVTENLDRRFDKFPWLVGGDDFAELLDCWRYGRTGYAIVDAGMRELYETGVMHNRVRMIVGSFLVKNLLIDWRVGEAWFWDCLVDADIANNVANWQWIAGCGADAAPYFRVFNPLLQAKKFDGGGDYIRRFIDVGGDGLFPIVDLAESRNRALAAYRSLKR